MNQYFASKIKSSICIGCCFFSMIACGIKMKLPKNTMTLSGQQFYESIISSEWEERDSFAVSAILSGNVPDFFKKFVPIKVQVFNPGNGRRVKIKYFVSPDYVSVGNNKDWARVPLTPMAAKIIVDSLQCFLPTPKMVDDIYDQAKIKLGPVPMYAFRDSAITMWHHHLIIEGQRKNLPGLISGIKKDVVNTTVLKQEGKGDRVAIYGWHRLDGRPIQPLYTGHIDHYVDYSHGIRLVYQRIKVNGKWKDYKDVFGSDTLRPALSREGASPFSE